jgi:hypothetical protein
VKYEKLGCREEEEDRERLREKKERSKRFSRLGLS